MSAVRKLSRLVLMLCLLTGLVVMIVVYGANEQEKEKVVAPMKTVCVGRFLIDVPANARVVLGLGLVEGFEVMRHNESHAAFAARLLKREAELSAKSNVLGMRNIESIKTVQHLGLSGKIFVHGRYRGYGIEHGQSKCFETISVEGYAHKADATYSFVANTYDPERASVLPALPGKLADRAENDIPTEPGFCISGALLRDPSNPSRSESVAMSASLPGHPNLGVRFWTNSAAAEGGSLLKRHEDAMGRLTRARTRILRKGARTINGHAGEEVAIKLTEFNFATVFSFVWETPGSDDNVLVPHLVLELDTGMSPQAGGAPVQSSLDEDAALLLWNQILSSIRLRPAGHAQVAGTSPAPPLRRMLAKSGAAVPDESPAGH